MWKIFIWLRNVAACVGALWLVATLTPLVSWWNQQLAQPWGTCGGDTLVVLGGDALGDAVLGSSSYWRAVYTVRAMRAHTFKKVIISGGGGQPGQPAPAELIRDFIRGHGVDVSNVTPETESVSTVENARAAIRLGGSPAGKTVLLTSDFHTWRAYRVFRQAGLEVDTCPVPDIGKRVGHWPSRAALAIELATETAKIGWYRWKGWLTFSEIQKRA